MRCRKLVATEYVADPDMSTVFRMFEGLEPADMRRAEVEMNTAARIYVDNAIVTRALQEFKKYCVVEEINDPKDVKPIWERGYAFTSTVLNRGMDADNILREQRWVVPDVRLQNKIIVLQLESYEFLAMYSLGPVRGDLPLEPGCILRKEMRIKFGMTSTQGIMYNVNNWPTEEMLRPRPVESN